ncbi:hypothetical protein KAF25_010848, partial [Fusarium avenaceum]
ADYLNDSVVQFDEMKETYTYLITQLVSRKVGVINIGRRGVKIDTGNEDIYGISGRPEGYPLPEGYDPVLDFGKLVKFPGSPTLLMANHDYTVEEANALVGADELDLITFARAFICNPDLVPRIEQGMPFAQIEKGSAIYYGPGETPDQYYNDWPAASA